MLPVSAMPSQKADAFTANNVKIPAPNQRNPNIQTVPGSMAPEGIGRSRRLARSKSSSNASLRNMPPTYSRLIPRRTRPRPAPLRPPPSSQPARQLDQTVGRFETRPRTSRVRRVELGLRPELERNDIKGDSVTLI